MTIASKGEYVDVLMDRRSDALKVEGRVAIEKSRPLHVKGKCKKLDWNTTSFFWAE